MPGSSSRTGRLDENSIRRAAALVRTDGWMTTAAAAELLEVSPAQVRDLVRSGVLVATKLDGGGMLLVDEESVLRRRAAAPKAGRPLSEKNAWAMLWAVGGRELSWATSAERVRIHRYARRPLSQWPGLLSRRARVFRVRAPEFVTNRITRLDGTSIGGVAAALAHGAPLVSGAETEHELYLTPPALRKAREMPGIGWSSSTPNLVLRELPDTLPDRVVSVITTHDMVPLEVAAADLLDQGNERASRTAAELLRRNEG